MVVELVTKSGASPEQARALGTALGIGAAIRGESGLVDERGIVSFFDTKRFQQLPIKQLGAGKPDEKGRAITLEAPDIEAVKAIRVIEEDKALARFKEALKKSNIYPDEAKAHLSHSTFQAFDAKGKSVAKVLLDTRVRLNRFIDGIPLEGPGAKISATFDSEGNVTQLRYANREVEGGEKVTIFSQAQAEDLCAERFRKGLPGIEKGNLKLETKLIYYAPPLELRAVKVILPFYQCSGTAKIGKREIVLLDEIIPAIESTKYVPRIHFDANVKGADVEAYVAIEGCAPPYRIQWGSTSTPIDATTPSLSYTVKGKRRAKDELLTVTVMDANGITVMASQRLPVNAPVSDAPRTLLPGEISTRVGGVTDFGTENSVTNQFGDLEQGFVDEMVADGATRRFQWRGVLAWEQDFKDPADGTYIDNTDITFFVGHGNGGGFYFEDTTHDDNALDYNDADGDWGGKDIEWLALYSCQVLIDSWGGMNRFDRWKQEFDGLHLLLGFHTNAQANFGFSRAFSQNLLRAPGPMTVRQAWFEAIASDQPHDRVGVVMGVWRKEDGAWNYGDYFHGKGTVGPDIRGSDIGGYWTVTGP